MKTRNKPGNVETRGLSSTAGEMRAETTAEGVRRIAGYAAKFNVDSEDLGGFVETIRPGCFADAITNCDIRALVDHNPTLILGRLKSGTLRLSEDQTGLRYEVDLPDTQAARDIYESIKRGDVSGSSFGFVAVKDAWTFGDDGSARRELIECHLFDVSAVTYPAYPDADVGVRSMNEQRSKNTPPAAPPAPVATPLKDAAMRWIATRGVV